MYHRFNGLVAFFILLFYFTSITRVYLTSFSALSSSFHLFCYLCYQMPKGFFEQFVVLLNACHLKLKEIHVLFVNSVFPLILFICKLYYVFLIKSTHNTYIVLSLLKVEKKKLKCCFQPLKRLFNCKCISKCICRFHFLYFTYFSFCVFHNVAYTP